MTSNPVNPPSDAAGLKERLQRLELDLIRQRKRVNRTTALTVIVGVIALIAIAVYSYWGYREISIFSDPEKVVNLGEQMLNDNIPTLRRRLQIEIVESAPHWANTLSQEALAQIPIARERLVRQTTDYMDEALARTRSVTDEQFRDFLRDHHTDLEKKFDELATSPDLAAASLADLEQELDQAFQTNFQVEAADLLKKLTQAAHAFKRMQEGKNLNPEDQLERRAWMIARRIHTDNLGLTGVGLPATESVKPVVQKTAPASTGPKPVKKPRTPPSAEKDKKSAPEKDKPAPPDAGKKNDAGKQKDAAPDAGKKKDTPTDPEKKKDGPGKPDNKD